MAVITTRFHESWFTAGFGFHMLLDPISDQPPEPGDETIIYQSMAVSMLNFDRQDPAASIRIARRLLEISGRIGVELADSDDTWDISFRNHLPDLDELLQAVIEGTGSNDDQRPEST